MASFYRGIILICVMALAFVDESSSQADDSTDVAAGCPRVHIISRSEWNATSPTRRTALRHPVPQVFICHTVTSHCTTLLSCCRLVERIQNIHKNNNGWPDIGYNFLVGEDGNVYEGRGWDTVGAYSIPHNSDSIGIAFIGNFNDRKPNDAALNATKRLISCGILQGKVSCGYTLHAHHALARTQYPVNTLYNEIRTWYRYREL